MNRSSSRTIAVRRRTRSFYPLLALCLLALSAPSNAAREHRLSREVPQRLDCEHHDDHPPLSSMVLARGESELVYLTGPLPEAVKMDARQPSGHDADVGMEAFRVAEITVKPRGLGMRERRFDPLLAIGPDTDGATGCALLAIKLTTSSSTVPGERTLELTLRGSFGERRVDVPVTIDDLTIAPPDFPDLQANFDRKDMSCEENIALYRKLADFGVNFATGLGSPSCYGSLLESTRFRGARLPGLSLPRMLAKDSPDDLVESTMEAVRSAIDPFTHMMHERPDAFHLKVLDEPQEGQFDFIDKVFARLGKELPFVRTEYTGHYRDDAVEFADINVNQIRRLTPALVRNIRSGGSKVWVYANDMLQPEKPYGSLRAIGFLLTALGADGFHLWNVTRCVDDWRTETAYWKSPHLNGGEKLFSGAGCLVYRESEHYAPSLRLEAVRDAMEDYAIAALVDERTNGGSGDLVTATVKFEEGRRHYHFDAISLHDDLLREIAGD